MKTLIDCSGLQLEDVTCQEFNEFFSNYLSGGLCCSFLVRVNLPNALATSKIIRNIDPNSDLVFLDLSDVECITSEDLLLDFLVKNRFEKLAKAIIHNEVVGSNSVVGKSRQISLCYLPLAGKTFLEPQISSAIAKHSLTIVSPYLPEKTGVADYVSQILPHLAGYYNYYLVTDASDDIRCQMIFPGEIISTDEFLLRPDLHQRVLYHIGNSHFHWNARALLKRIPGIVVLHDFFIGESTFQIPDTKPEIDKFLSSLIREHGLQSLWHSAHTPLPILARSFPVCLDVIQSSKHVIVHSKHAADLAARFYSNQARDKCSLIPHHEQLRPILDKSSIDSIRNKYSISDDSFVVVTFGFGGPSKCHEAIIFAWMNSLFVNDNNAKLVFVGDYSDPLYLERLHLLIKTLGGCSNISFTGYVDQEVFQDYLYISNLALQLRAGTWGESSGTVLDCMASGLPTIVTDIGSFSELPDDAVWKVPGDRALPVHLIEAIEHLYQHPTQRNSLSAKGLEYISSYCDPDKVAKSYFDVIERFSIQTGVYKKSLELNTYQRIKLARVLATNDPDLGMPRLFVDVTALAELDLRTGVQRVTRSLLVEIMNMPPKGYRVEPVYLDSGLQRYRYARKFSLELLGLEDATIQDEVVFPMTGDCFFGLDLHPGSIARAEEIFGTWRNRGVRIVFLLHDMLPVRHPEWFPPSEFPFFSGWLKVLSQHADGVIAVSKTSANDFVDWVEHLQAEDRSPVAIDVAWFHNGADFKAGLPSLGFPPNESQILAKIEGAPSFLMVSTVEPRKGHEQVLSAFEDLWANGLNINLVIVGKQGWMVEELAERIYNHPEYDKRLFWLQGISDEFLEVLYQKSRALIAASFGEGFGLPLVEAAVHGVNVIARDIPVFREVGGKGADYFTATSSTELASFIRSWLHKTTSEHANPREIKICSWKEAARIVMPFVLGLTNDNLMRV